MQLLIHFDDPRYECLSLDDEDFIVGDSSVCNDTGSSCCCSGCCCGNNQLSSWVLKSSISEARDIPVAAINLYINGILLGDNDVIVSRSNNNNNSNSNNNNNNNSYNSSNIGRYNELQHSCNTETANMDDVVVRVVLWVGGQRGGLLGGKGGFGAMLRMQSKLKGKKTTTDFGACRDLSGRRLRHVNDERILEKWNEAKANDVDFDVDQATATGIDLWFLSAPAWADKLKKNHRSRFLKPRRKTSLCKDWETGQCPRGKKCEFAHGAGDLRGKGKEEYEQNMKNRERQLNQQKKDDYMSAVYTADDDDDDIADMVTQGLRAAKRAKRATSAASAETMEDTVIQKIKKSEANIVIDESTQVATSSSSSTTTTTTATTTTTTTDSTKWLKTVSGDLELTVDGEVEGKSDFGTAVVANCALRTGTWYYEVELLSDGLIQIGWANDLFNINAGEDGTADGADGVGDDENSWAYDGFRNKKWHVDDDDYGLSGSLNTDNNQAAHSWMSGDIIGCVLCLKEDDNSQKSMTISFTHNGRDLGIAFREDDVPSDRVFYPAVSLEDKEAVMINIGNQAFAYPPSFSFNTIDSHLVSRLIELSPASHSQSNPQQLTLGPIDLCDDIYDDIENIKALGLAVLKAELDKRAIKAGGSIDERAHRLFIVRRLKDGDDVPVHLKAKRKG